MIAIIIMFTCCSRASNMRRATDCPLCISAVLLNACVSLTEGEFEISVKTRVH